MSFNNYTPLAKLQSSRIKWNIRVRAQAVWKGITRDTKEFRGINLLLVDDSRFRIHAFVNAKFAQQFEKDLAEGEIYNISNFIVQEYTGVEFHRCVRFDKHIYFAEYTKLEKSCDGELKIPQCSFDLFNLEDLEKMESDKRFLCDVAGILKDETELRDYVNDNQEAKKQKKFTLTDGRCTVKVTLFDQFAESVEEAIRNEQHYPVTIIIASAKIGRFQGELTLTNYPATRIYLNYNHKAVEDLKLRAIEQPTFYKDLVPIQEQDLPQKMTVSQIKKLSDTYIERKVFCEVTIKKVEENLHWYDCICNKCKLLLIKQNERFQCGKCGKHYPWPPKRFRVCLFGCDLTGGLPIILGDREVRKLTGKTVFDITLDQAEGDEDRFPEVIKQFRNKQYKITLKISAENVKNESEVYEATDIVVEGEEINAEIISEAIASPSAEDDNTITQAEFANTQSVMQSTLMETPIVNKSVKNTKIRKSPENEEQISDDMCISKLKNVKVKKEKFVADIGKEKKSPATQSSSSKARNVVLSQAPSCIEDANIPLKKLPKITKKKEKQAKQQGKI